MKEVVISGFSFLLPMEHKEKSNKYKRHVHPCLQLSNFSAKYPDIICIRFIMVGVNNLDDISKSIPID